MSHIKLVIVVQTDKDDFAQRRETLGAGPAAAEQCDRVANLLRNGRDGGEIRDVNGNVSGRWDLSEVRD